MSINSALLLRLSFQVLDQVIWVECEGTERAVTGIAIDTAAGRLAKRGAHRPASALARRVARALQAYFVDPAAGLKVPLAAPAAAPNQRAAMAFLSSIPCGQTRSYAQQAAYVRSRRGNRFGPRNAGAANHANPFPLAIPCHRVVRSDGSLGGFMGSSRGAAVRLKQALLALESKAVAGG